MRLSVKVVPKTVKFDVWLLFARRGSDECPSLPEQLWEDIARRLSEELRYNAGHVVTNVEDEYLCLKAGDGYAVPDVAECLSVKYPEDLDEWKATLSPKVVEIIDKFNSGRMDSELVI